METLIESLQIPTMLDLKTPTNSQNVYNSRIVAFPDEYALSTLLRPDIPQAESVRVQKLQRLTPLSYDRNIFHFELDLTDTQRLKDYKMGDALAVYPKNTIESVEAFIRVAVASPDQKDSKTAIEAIKQQIVTLPSSIVSTDTDAVVTDHDEHKAAVALFPTSLTSSLGEEGPLCVTTVERLLTTILDISGNPGKEFFKQLSTYAIDILEKVRLAEFTLERLQNEFTEVVVNGATTYTSVLEAFPSARPPMNALIEMIPPMKPRLYSIASSSLYRPGQLDLLVVEETWKPTHTTIKQLNPLYGEESSGCSRQVKLESGKMRAGLCSHYLSTLKKGDTIMASLTASTMYLPPSQLAPVVMAGLGTGMAPFRAFLQEKMYWKKMGVGIGPLALYFGSRHKEMEFLYGDELEAMQSEGVLTRLNCAFSRDQPQKIYIQDRIKEDAEWLAQLLLKECGSFYLCGPTWPAEDVKEALITAFMKFGGIETKEEAEEILKEMKEASRYVLEVY